MRTGRVGIELELALTFHDDGPLSGLHSVALGDKELPEPLAKALYNYLINLREFDKMRDDAWENAEEDPLEVF